jgi:hypothetical protein
LSAKLLRIQALGWVVKAQAIDPDVLVGVNKKSVHEVENILKVALAIERRNGQHTENTCGPLIRLKRNF